MMMVGNVCLSRVRESGSSERENGNGKKYA